MLLPRRSKNPPGRRSAGSIAALVTGPIHKARMYEIGFEFPGQTEFFAAAAAWKISPCC